MEHTRWQLPEGLSRFAPPPLAAVAQTNLLRRVPTIAWIAVPGVLAITLVVLRDTWLANVDPEHAATQRDVGHVDVKEPAIYAPRPDIGPKASENTAADKDMPEDTPEVGVTAAPPGDATPVAKPKGTKEIVGEATQEHPAATVATCPPHPKGRSMRAWATQLAPMLGEECAAHIKTPVSVTIIHKITCGAVINATEREQSKLAVCVRSRLNKKADENWYTSNSDTRAVSITYHLTPSEG